MVDILAFGAHPDDIELSCGALLIKTVNEGGSVALVDLTIGEKGTAGNRKVRRQEANRAAAMLGAERTILDFPDCEVIDSYHGRLELVKVIRHYQPRLVIAPRWNGTSTHPDHLACGLMARVACRYARFAKILPDIPIHRPDGILHTPMPQEIPDFLIDITPFVERWKALICCHKSQVEAHPYVDRSLSNAHNLGRLIGVDYAQGLTKGNPVQIMSPLDVAKGTLEL